jgi:hypothetical protein
MKVGRTHLVASLAMVAASIAYNVWVFTRPAGRSTPVASAAPLVDQSAGPVVTGDQTAAAIDPTTLPPPPDVDLVHAPEWTRNPFTSPWLRRPDRVVAPVAEPDVEPDVAVASILHSAERSLAVVNGRIVRAGDRIGSNTILEIQPRAIVVESPRGGRRTFELRGPQATKELR